jgi:urate oxidase
MHIHGNSSQLNTINPYAAAAEKATAEKRAANVSKRLTKKASAIKAGDGADEQSLLAQWMEGSQQQPRRKGSEGERLRSSRISRMRAIVLRRARTRAKRPSSDLRGH